MFKVDPPSHQTRYYVIFNDLTYYLSQTLEDAERQPNSLYILKNEITTIPYLPKTSNIVYNNTESYFEIFDNEGTPLKFIEDDGWCFEFLRFGVFKSYSYTHFWIRLTDRKGETIENDDERYPLTPDGFIAAIKRFNQLKEYDDYQFAVVSLRLKAIEAKLKEAETRIAKLEKRLQ